VIVSQAARARAPLCASAQLRTPQSGESATPSGSTDRPGALRQPRPRATPRRVAPSSGGV
jgi:hypothetical protein